MYIYVNNSIPFAIDHRTWKTGLPVRSVKLKPCAGRLVVGWVTTSEYLLLIVFALAFCLFSLLFILLMLQVCVGCCRRFSERVLY